MASARPADCTLRVASTTYIAGTCDFSQFDNDGSFQIRSFDGRHFAQVSMRGKGVGDGYWNGTEGGKRAHSPLGQLVRRDGCWINEYASVCAY